MKGGIHGRPLASFSPLPTPSPALPPLLARRSLAESQALEVEEGHGAQRRDLGPGRGELLLVGLRAAWPSDAAFPARANGKTGGFTEQNAPTEVGNIERHGAEPQPSNPNPE